MTLSINVKPQSRVPRVKLLPPSVQDPAFPVIEIRSQARVCPKKEFVASPFAYSIWSTTCNDL
jgi:hypothetical protein